MTARGAGDPTAFELSPELLDLLPAAVYICDAEGLIRYYNRWAVKLWGRAPRCGDSDERFCGAFRLFRPDGSALPHAATPMAEALRTGRPQHDLEVIIQRPDDTRIAVLVNIDPLINTQGQILGAVNVFQDITERKQAEQERSELLVRERAARAEAEAAHRRYRELVDGLDAIVWEADAQSWQFTFVSRRAEQILGYPVERWLGEPGFWVNLIHPEDRSWASQLCQNACAECLDHDFEYRAVAADGRIVWLRDIVYVVPGADGRASHLRGVMVDVTRTKELDAALKQRAVKLVEADRRKDEFLAMLAHELRNPLAAISNGAMLLEQSALNEEEAILSRQVINRQVKHLARLIDDLLDVSRVSRGKIQLRRQSLDAASTLRQAIDVVQPLINQRRQTLNVSYQGPLELVADPARLEQIVVNLLTNASKYTDCGGTIWLSAGIEGSDLVITVRDNGMGIAPEQLEGMFELFAQGDRSLARSEGGLGIGLTLARALAEMHGGRINASSDGPGQGSTFTVWLPTSEPGRARPGPHGPRAKGARNGTARILVVDDNVDAAQGLSRLLKLLGHQVQEAYGAFEALEVADAFGPQFVLLDIGLPGMDGYEVAARLRAQPSCQDAVLIAVTGYGQQEDRQRSRASGFEHHLVKPVDLDVLATLLDRDAGRNGGP